MSSLPAKPEQYWLVAYSLVLLTFATAMVSTGIACPLDTPTFGAPTLPTLHFTRRQLAGALHKTALIPEDTCVPS